MPLYDYRCDCCEEEFEAIRPFSKRDDVKCPKCNKKAKRLISGFSVKDGSSSSRSSSSYGANCNWRGG